MAAWLIRAGSAAEREDWCLEHGYAGGGWWEVGDLADATSRQAVRARVLEAFPHHSDGFRGTHTGQLHALRNRIAVDDLVVLPRKSRQLLAIGRVTHGYQYLGHEPNLQRRHTVGVGWERIDVPREAIGQDLLRTLNSNLTVCEVSRNDGAWRIAQVLETGQDPR